MVIGEGGAGAWGGGRCIYHPLSYREDKGDQLSDYKQELQAMEAELKKLRQEVRPRVARRANGRHLRGWMTDGC